ncbi:superoxide dismutase, Fe-Mn family [Alteribacillus bidgolensis]|uniref:superoxide dismutase n=1 Tax=Alteribacillus bidgolensis TaxID=930129 RepID=A0A1G8RIU9_9BACI|nr:superoxide dismutase, Fe-Mn family [Alteribacillus bidgolensis]
MSLFALTKLPYDYDELEPFIDAQTLEINHSKHHATYVNNLNVTLEKYDDLKLKPLEELLSNLDSLPTEERTSFQNNGGGHYCHSLFWELKSQRGRGEPTADILKAIDQFYGSTIKGSYKQVRKWIWVARA